MKKIVNQKGITLIALIITIIVLLILAVVTIGSINNSNIIAYAQNAATNYNTKKGEEESIISGYESLIESNLPGNSITIPNGTYYYCGDNTESNYLVIADEGNELYWEGTKFVPTITIESGVVNMTINGISGTFKGKYYETTNNNKIITLGTGEFGTSQRTKNSRDGFIFAINTNDLKYDATGIYKSTNKNIYELHFTEGSNVAVYKYSGNTEGREYIYAWFEDMFYINGKQVKEIGLEEGFAWGDDDGYTYTKTN